MAKAKSKASNIVVWIILGLLVVALAGFGIDSFGGSVRTVGKVGDREIRVQDYFRALQQEIRAATEVTGSPVSFQQAQQMGLDTAVLAQLVTRAALENEAMQIGISIGDERVRDELLAIPAFTGIDGRFNRDAYRFALQQEGFSESEFEDRLRLDVARSILQAAVISGAPPSATLVDTLFGYLRERRSFTAIRLDARALDAPLPPPTEEQLRARYEATPEAHTLPEARRITYAWLTPVMLLDTVDVDEQSLRDFYEARITEFVRPERRLVDRLIFPDMGAARAAMDRIEAGTDDFDALAAERGFALDDIDLGDLTRDEVDAAAADAVFGLDAPGVVGPFESPFGPALYRMNAVLAGEVTSFEQARPMLRDELAQDRARRVITDQFDLFEDLLAGGATLEDLAAETEMELGRIDFRPDSREGIAAYEAFRSSARAAREGGFPAIEVLEDGGVFALRLDAIVPPQLQPFEAVLDAVTRDWEAAETEARLTARAEGLVDTLAGGTDPAELGLPVEVVEGIMRDSFIQDLPERLVDAAFTMEPGETRVIPGRSGSGAAVVHVLILDAIQPAGDDDSPEARQLRRTLTAQLGQSVQQDLFTYFARILETEAGIEINSAAVQAVHAQFR